MLTIAAVAAPFDRDIEASFARITAILAEARAAGAQLVVLPEAAIGGYVADLQIGSTVEPPPALDPAGPELRRLAAMAGDDLVITVGFCELADDGRFNAAACVAQGEVLSVYRKVHQPLGEDSTYRAGSTLSAFDTPVGRMGMQICWDKGFAESARTLALDGATVIACMSAWPVSRTARAATIDEDRWTHRFDRFDVARAMDNQVVWVASNQTGSFGSLDFCGHAKVVGPGGDVLAITGTEPGLAIASFDVDAELAAHRAGMCVLRDRRPDAYRLDPWIEDRTPALAGGPA
jgi:predicted amidohydrolase